MPQYPIISIDLGASFTKVGFRTSCAPGFGCPYNENTQLLLGRSVLIPSLAIQTNNAKQPWLFGSTAAAVSPGKEMCVYSNWKAGLFNRTNNPNAAQAAIVAQAFFTWLRPYVEAAAGSLDDKIVRIMLPAFQDFGLLAEVMKRCIEMAGWRPRNLTVATEPHANAIGVLTEGRNIVTMGTNGEFQDFVGMYGYNNPYIKRARAAVLQEDGQTAMRMGLIDIGAFTTDVALLDFNLVGPPSADDGLKCISQKSFEVGTHKFIDEPLWSDLGKRYGTDFTARSFLEREEIKRTLLIGETVATIISGSRVTLGDEIDMRIVNRLTTEFTDAIWQNVGGPIETSATNVVYLTGGGAAIKSVAKGLAARRPFLSTFQTSVAFQAGEGDKVRFVDWRNTDGTLERVATALGGASVLAPVTLEAAPIISLESLPQNLGRKVQGERIRRCTCHGNPDCPRCGGTGYLN